MIGVVGALQVAVHLAAQPSLGDGMVGVALDADGAAAGGVNGDLPGAGVGAVVGANAGDEHKGFVEIGGDWVIVNG